MSYSTLKELICQGLSQRKIGQLLNCSQSTVRFYLKKYNLHTNKRTKKLQFCKDCGNAFDSHWYKQQYCSNKCQQNFIYKSYINRWLNNQECGIGKAQMVSKHIKKWLLLQRGERCWECGWDKKHPISGKCPLEVDHIDGNYANNGRDNLRLICANCHSLTSTYRGRNRGHGKPYRYTKLAPPEGLGPPSQV